MSAQPELFTRPANAGGVIVPFERPHQVDEEMHGNLAHEAGQSSEQHIVIETINWLNAQMRTAESCLEEWINIGETNETDLEQADLKIHAIEQMLGLSEILALVENEGFTRAVVSRDTKKTDLGTRANELEELQQSTQIFKAKLEEYRGIALGHLDKIVTVLERIQAKIAEFAAIKVHSDRRQTQLQELLNSIGFHEGEIAKYEDVRLHASQSKVNETFGIHQEHDPRHMELASVALENPYVMRDLEMRKMTIERSQAIVADYSARARRLEEEIRSNTDQISSIFEQLEKEMDEVTANIINPAMADSGEWDTLRDQELEMVKGAVPTPTYGLLSRE